MRPERRLPSMTEACDREITTGRFSPVTTGGVFFRRKIGTAEAFGTHVVALLNDTFDELKNGLSIHSPKRFVVDPRDDGMCRDECGRAGLGTVRDRPRGRSSGHPIAPDRTTSLPTAPFLRQHRTPDVLSRHAAAELWRAVRSTGSSGPGPLIETVWSGSAA